MDERRTPPLRNSSQTAAKVAVAVLIVIAIAGFVLAGLRSHAPAPEQATTADPTPETAAPLTAATPAAASGLAQPADLPNQIAFASASASLSEDQAAKVRKLATTAQTQRHNIGILSKAEAGGAQFGLAQQRTLVVRQTLEQSGVPLGRMTIEISQLPRGVISAADANRVEVVMR
jgi:outer membrane protein OmpA-like peptidoglycan-associated protein